MVGAANRDPRLAALLAETARATGGLVIEDASFLTLDNAYEQPLLGRCHEADGEVVQRARSLSPIGSSLAMISSSASGLKLGPTRIR
jgi:hypothetical protein